MRIRCRAWALLAACAGMSMLIGCGGSSTPAPAPAASSSPSTAAPAPAPAMADASASGGDMAGAQSDGSGAADYGAANSGMGATTMMPPGASGGMADSSGMGGMSMNGGIAGPGIADTFDSGGMNPGMMGGAGMSGSGMGMAGMPGMGGMGGMPAVQDPAPPEDADYLSKAKYAFAIGKEVAAEPYVVAEMLANEAEAANLLQQIRFSAALRKPALSLRFGVGVMLEAPTGVTDYKPIGRTQYANMNGQGGGGGSGGGESMGMMGMPGSGGGGQGASNQKSLGDLTGRFGEELIKMFEGEWDSGAFGSVFADVETIVPVNRLNPNGMGGMGGMPGMMGMSGGADSSGMAMGAGMDMPGMGGQNAPPPAGEALRLKATAGKAIVPGLTFLGTGKESEILGKAEAEGIDYLFFFEVDVKSQRQRILNDTKLKLMAVKEKKNLGATSTLNNNKVDVEMATKGDSDDVAKQLANLFRKVETIKLQEMPKLKPEAAQMRVKSLIEKKSKDVLPILMEIKLYHSQGSLNDEERDAAYQLTLPNGLAFANGSPEDRAFVLDPLLPGYK